MATFPNYKIDADSSYSREPRLMRAPFGDGYSQVLGDGINPYNEVWSISFTNRPKADIADIKAFLDNHNGATPFEWSPPDDASVKKWRMVGEYEVSNAEANVRTISFKVERYFGP